MCVFFFQEVPNFPRPLPNSVRVLHPVVYACTALLLLCLFTIIITHILHHRYFSVCNYNRLHICFISSLVPSVSPQFYSYIKKKLAHITEYLLPHCHDNSHLCRRHMFDQLPSSLSSSKSYVHEDILINAMSFKLDV